MARYNVQATRVIEQDIEFLVIAKTKKAAKQMARTMSPEEIARSEVVVNAERDVRTKVGDIIDIDLPDEQESLIDEDDL